jgi:poly(A) polymerase
MKLLQTGHALASLEALKTYGLIGAGQGVFPILDFVLDMQKKHASQARFIQLVLASTDERVKLDKSVSSSFMLACLLWHDVLGQWQLAKTSGVPPFPALQQAIEAVFDARIGDISGRGKLAGDMREIWLMQPRFERRVGNSPYTLVEQFRFRAGLDFLELRAKVGEMDIELFTWWQQFAQADAPERAALIEQVKMLERQKKINTPVDANASPKKRRPRRKPLAPAVSNE